MDCSTIALHYERYSNVGHDDGIPLCSLTKYVWVAVYVVCGCVRSAHIHAYTHINIRRHTHESTHTGWFRRYRRYEGLWVRWNVETLNTSNLFRRIQYTQCACVKTLTKNKYACVCSQCVLSAMCENVKTLTASRRWICVCIGKYSLACVDSSSK